MPSSTVQSFTEPGDYGASIRAVTAELVITARGQFAAKLTRIDLHHLWMQRFSDNLPRVAHSAAGKGRSIISFRTQPGPSLLWRGIETVPTAILWHSDGDDSFQRSSGLASWGSMSLPIEKMAVIGAAMSGCDLTPPRDALSVAPSPSAMARLQRLHAAAGDLAEYAPEVASHAEAARGLENALIEAMVACLSTRDQPEDPPAQRRHDTIMRRFYAAIAEHPGEALYIPDICAALGVPQRTLNVCCHESLGVGPKRYLLLRRMNLARQALHLADAARTTVTQIAADFGFWSFGRFAVEYRELFGETPSATLRGQRQ
jgi:AraC-like DNA-binding protein